jgi:hypothetical protein
LNFAEAALLVAFAAGAWMLMRGRVRPARRAAGADRDGNDIEYRPARLYTGGAGRPLLILFNVVSLSKTFSIFVPYPPGQMPTGRRTSSTGVAAVPLVAAALLAGTFVHLTFRPITRDRIFFAGPQARLRQDRTYDC